MIEVGDYVNGLEVISTGETYPDATYTNKYKYLLTTSYKEVIKNEDIESVVTKEYFEQGSYKIGG